MKNYKHIVIFCVLVLVLTLNACQSPKGNTTGSEYMPDMAHSVAYEANVYNYYYYNTWDSASVKKLKDLSNPGLPVEGSVPRGYAGIHYAQGEQAQQEMMATLTGASGLTVQGTPLNGHVPYYYEDTEEERTRATEEIIANPFPITDRGLATGENLYNINCGICHGEKGDGNGWLVDEANANAVYPAAPANFLNDEFSAASNGRYYHAIYYGKNVMGGYTDKLSYEERWQVIHHIRALQAKDKGLVYNAESNTLNAVFGTPGGKPEIIAVNVPAGDEAHHEDGDHGKEGEHDDHGGDHKEDHGDGHDEDHGHEGDGH